MTTDDDERSTNAPRGDGDTRAPTDHAPVPANQRYRLNHDPIQGGMGRVYLGEDMLLRRRVALKTPLDNHEPRVRRFEEELLLHAPLLHPSIIPVLDHGMILLDGVWLPYFTMPEHKNGHFTRRILEVHEVSQRHGRWSCGAGWTFRRLIEAVQRVADAVSFAHHKGVLHLDINPKNVLTGGTDAEVLLCDWGLSRSKHPPPRAERPERPSAGGTPGFIAPERLDDPKAWPDVGHDVYALGALLYTVLTNHAPYEAHATPEDRNAAARAEAPQPPESLTPLPLPPDLLHLTRYAMHRDPNLRAPSARHVSAELKRWLDLGPSALPGGDGR